ncbi:MAG TPA: biotin--[acetyl-CoA-carboxylase] ligase [Pelovirga sp.]|nr:biotin--[acetyl-CoA-carboxylase] ligase [Pelovirga sp.]
MNASVSSSRDRILALLRCHSDSWLSGEKISSELQLSRAAIWKQISALRALGVAIEARHAKGYRLLEPDDLLFSSEIVSGLDYRIVGRSLNILQAVDSTNLQLKAQAEAGAQEGTVVVADQQLAGKGRLGRQWASPAGVNLYCSILLRPQIPVQQAPQLTFLSAVAVVDVLEAVGGVKAQVKWPNDILVGGAKIAGLLNEMSAETEQINYVVLGLGINLNMTTEQFPPELNYPATSVLLETGQPVIRRIFLRALLERLDFYYAEFLHQGFAPIRQRWEQLCPIINRQVTVDSGPFATVVGLDEDGALRLQFDAGTIERIVAGDVRLVN